MIECYISANGYYIYGDGLEIMNSISPLSVRGELVLDHLQHIYAVTYLALCELKGHGKDRVFVYNDSRLIDDMNGLKPLDHWFESAKTMIRRRLIPSICAVVFFRKKSEKEIQEKIQYGISSLSIIDPDRDKKMINRIDIDMKLHEAAVKTKATSLKRRWFDAET